MTQYDSHPLCAYKSITNSGPHLNGYCSNGGKKPLGKETAFPSGKAAYNVLIKCDYVIRGGRQAEIILPTSSIQGEDKEVSQRRVVSLLLNTN